LASKGKGWIVVGYRVSGMGYCWNLPRRNKVMATIDGMSAYFQAKHDLPENWEVYSLQCIPKNEYTHMELKGCVTSVFKRGPRKGQKKYTGELEKVFILSNEEYKLIDSEKVAPRKTQYQQGSIGGN
jgi:hypothetical protein